MSETLTRIDSFPFDSKPDGYDADGYPVYDRAVGATMFRAVLGSMFSDGVLGDGAADWQIRAAQSGLAVVVQPGAAVIAGGIGAMLDEATLDLGDSPAGNVTYSIMLRFDANDDMRSIYLVVDKGDAGGTPTPKEPDKTLANVVEYRLGYAYVPSGAKDMSGATIVNEKGLAVCPYAAPFERIDVSEVLADVKRDAMTAYNSFMAYLSDNIDFLDAAIDDTVAGQLQAAINALGVYARGNVTDTQFNLYLDGNVETTATDEDFTRLHHMRAYNAKVLDLVQEPLAEVEREVEGLDARLSTLELALKGLDDFTWSELYDLRETAEAHPSLFSDWVGQTKTTTVNGATTTMTLVGVAHDDLAGGGKAGFSFIADALPFTHRMNESNTTSGGWASTEMRSWLSDEVYETLGGDLKPYIRQVAKKYSASVISNSTNASATASDRLWIPSASEVFGINSYGNEGAQYQWFSQGGSNIKKLNGSAYYWWLRSVSHDTSFRLVDTDGSIGRSYASGAYGVAVGFCI